jgi:predicted outer membrane repeat protein/parallel beta-helix repeat protein
MRFHEHNVRHGRHLPFQGVDCHRIDIFVKRARKHLSTVLALTCVTCVAAFAALLSCDNDSVPTKPVVPTPGREPRSVLVKYDRTGDYPTIQAAINSAIHGDTIVLANGRFRGPENRDLDFRALRIILRSQSNDPVACVIDCDGTSTDPHRGFSFHSGEDARSVVEGVTIQDGYGRGGGAAVLCESSSPTLRNVIIRGHGTSAVTCDMSSPTFENCTFFSNWAGGMYCSSGSSPSLTSCTFWSNVSDGDGAAIFAASSTITLTDCVFTRNTSFSGGGAIQCSTIPDVGRSVVTAYRCLFESNAAAYYGGAVNATNSDVAMAECTFIDNTAGLGGGAVATVSHTLASISQATFYGNSSPIGSAMLCASGSEVLVLSTILSFGSGAAPLVCDTLLGPVQLAVSCSDVFGNGGGDWVGCLEGLEETNDNMSADPLFCAPLDGSLHLMPGSPCAAGPASCPLVGAWSVGCTVQSTAGANAGHLFGVESDW